MTSQNASFFHLRQSETAGNPRSLAIEYGEMLPKEGVKSLPDYKVIAFLRVLQDYGRSQEKTDQYIESKRAKTKFKQIAKIELRRQLRTMQKRQTMELYKIEDV